MTQNMSHAVMAQRTESHVSLDDFPPPPWAIRAFVKYFRGQGLNKRLPSFGASLWSWVVCQRYLQNILAETNTWLRR